MLISLHIPKTAGRSFENFLEEKFPSKILYDYSNKLLSNYRLKCATALCRCVRNWNRFAEYDCIHGHFPVVKYRLLGARRNATFVTWMRDPVERLASHYYYWKRYPDSDPKHVVLQKMLKQNWSIEQFCLAPELQNTCSKFFWAFPFERFDFVGITEHFDEDLSYFAKRFFGDDAPETRRINVNPERRDEVYISDPALRRKIEKYHAKDMLFYRWALDMRNARLAALSMRPRSKINAIRRIA